MAIYKVESDKWNNTEGWNYIAPTTNTSLEGSWGSSGDICEISYKNSEYNEAICEEKWKATADYKNNTEYKFIRKSLITECNESFTKEF